MIPVELVFLLAFGAVLYVATHVLEARSRRRQREFREQMREFKNRREFYETLRAFERIRRES